MPTIPTHVLSDHFADLMQGRRPVCAVFVTFRFDPGFFEQEVLPLIFDVPLSHSPVLRLLQLEEPLRGVTGGVAVYYDQNGLVSESGRATLDVQRIPIRKHRGVFHPKNAFLLLEDVQPDEQGERRRMLVVTSMSANLTRAGWWENLEACHTECLSPGEVTRLRDDVLTFLDRLKSRAGARAGDRPDPLQPIREFLRGTEQRARRSNGGVMFPHFYAGNEPFVDFLKDCSAGSLQELNLEVISPYFERGEQSDALNRLMEAFNPREVRVFLPRKESGEALCSPEFYQSVGALPKVCWGCLPKELLRSGKGADAKARTVHAKVYRFFRASPKVEFLFVGSVNLTEAAHSSKGNAESGYFVQLEPAQRPDWWLEADQARPRAFAQPLDGEETATSGGTRLSLSFHWDTRLARAYWDDTKPSPQLSVDYQGVRRFTLDALPPQSWVVLPAGDSSALEEILASTSIVLVSGDGPEPGRLLVQEERLSHRPSRLLELTPAEILEYWSLLSPDKKASFLETHAGLLAQSDEGLAYVAASERIRAQETLFDTFAGIFHGFGRLESAARRSLADPKDRIKRDAVYLLFGEKHDSIGNLIDRTAQAVREGRHDLVEGYVIALSAQQVLEQIACDYPDFWSEHRDDVRKLNGRLRELQKVEVQLIERNKAGMAEFLPWFRRHFLDRATPIDGRGVE